MDNGMLLLQQAKDHFAQAVEETGKLYLLRKAELEAERTKLKKLKSRRQRYCLGGTGGIYYL